MASKTRASFLFFLPTTLPLVLLFTSTTLTIHTQSQTQDSGSDSDSDYNACKPFMCGNINFTFPFVSSETFGSGAFDCGLPHFKISCDASSSIPSLELYGRPYQVKSLFSSERLVTVVDDKLINNLTFSSSCKSLHNLTIPTAAKDTAGARLSLASFGANLTVFECPDGLSLSSRSVDGVFGNFSYSEGYKVYFWDQVQGVSPVVSVEVPSGCMYVNLPVLAVSRNRKAFLDTPNVTGLAYWLGDGFPLHWPDFEECTGCEKTGGRCGYDGSSRRIVCFCKGLQPNLRGCLSINFPRRKDDLGLLAVFFSQEYQFPQAHPFATTDAKPTPPRYEECGKEKTNRFLLLRRGTEGKRQWHLLVQRWDMCNCST